MKQYTVFAQSGSKKYASSADASGNFSITASGGNYVISIAHPGEYWGFCGVPNSVTLAAGNDTTLLNISAQSMVLCPELTLSVGSSAFRRCFDDNYLVVQYQNIGTAPAVNAYVSLTLDPKLIDVSSSATLLSQNGQTYQFDIGTLDVGETGYFYIYFKVDCNATIEEMLCVDSHIYPDTLCSATAITQSSNSFCMPVESSFDPNDKTAFVNGKPQTAQILPNSDLEYLIRFQNTGNDTAFNIIVVDTLSARLDAKSVIPGASSHPYVFELRNDNVLRFRFRGILLPDSSTNEPASHGFVKFYVRQTPGNPIGATLSNTAAIFFDYNEAVLTNESKLLVSSTIGTQEIANYLALKTSPVPAHERVTIHLPANAPIVSSWKLINQMGQVLSSGSKEASDFVIERKDLPGGIYWCQLRLENGELAFSRIVFD